LPSQALNELVFGFNYLSSIEEELVFALCSDEFVVLLSTNGLCFSFLVASAYVTFRLKARTEDVLVAVK